MYNKHIISILAINLCLIWFGLASVSTAQTTNPTAADCGLPTEGVVVSDVTYTLTADCTQTDRLTVNSDITLTIVGGGFTIDGSALNGNDPVVWGFDDSILSISNLTVDGGGDGASGAIRGDGEMTVSNVSVRNVYRAAFMVRVSGSATLSDILVENIVGTYYNRFTSGTAVHADGDATVTIEDILIRNVYYGVGAIVARPHTNATITLSGCFTSDGVHPIDVYGEGVTDNSAGTCSGTIGNGDSTATEITEAQAEDCGLPSGGYVLSDANYTLTADCEITSILKIKSGVTVTITGDGNSITSDLTSTAILNTGTLTLDNIVFEEFDARILLGVLHDSSTTISNSVFEDNETWNGLLLFADQALTIRDTRFEGNSAQSTSSSGAPSVARAIFGSSVSIHDSVFRDNSGGSGVLSTENSSLIAHYPEESHPSITLEDCIVFEGNTPENLDDPDSLVTDNIVCPETAESNSDEQPVERDSTDTRDSSPSVTSAFVTADPLPTATNSSDATDPPPTATNSSDAADPSSTATSVPAETAQPSPTPGPQGCVSTSAVHALTMGSVACIYRQGSGLAASMTVYGIDENATGYYLLDATQAQIDAIEGEGVVAVSADGRALIQVLTNGQIRLSVGPDVENKILHLTLQEGIWGAVAGMETTYGDAPGLPYLENEGA